MTENINDDQPINQQQQPEQQTKMTLQNVDRIMAFHETGHAIGRYLTAHEMGYEFEESIFCIDVFDEDNQPLIGLHTDGVTDVYSQAITYGPMLSRNMDIGTLKADGAPETDKFVLVKKAQENGTDIEPWLGARALIAVMGAMVEAVATKKQFFDILYSPECAGDLDSIRNDCDAAGLTIKEYETLVRIAIQQAVDYVKRPDICNAINQLASAICKQGSMDGKQVANIITTALQSA